MLLKPLVILAFAATALAAYSDPCNHPDGKGVCVSTSNCRRMGGNHVKGKCPNDPANVRCCHKRGCTHPSGCKKRCFKRKSGMCPGGSNYKMCVYQFGPGCSTPN